MVIHSKRARERIIYDEIMQTFIYQSIPSQQLLFPVSFEISPAEKMIWEENQKTLERLGFNWEIYDTGLNIQGVSAHLTEENIQESINNLHINLGLSQIDKGEIAHKIVSAIASAAARQKSNWNNESANQLLESLFQCADHQYSPKGKLILNTILSSDILQKF
jgi:DNA mismatch repair protein MutL